MKRDLIEFSKVLLLLKIKNLNDIILSIRNVRLE